MTIAESVVLGLTQGLTELIPVSSSGHLLIVQQVLQGAGDGFFLQFINIGTLAALLVYFRTKLWEVLGDIFKRKDWRLARNLVITSLPMLVAGWLCARMFDEGLFGGARVVIVMLVVVGLVMIFIDKIPKMSVVKSGKELSWQRALLVGAAQAISLIPGVSRSGVTIVAGRITGMRNREAAEYGFLAAIPVMIAVVLRMVVDGQNRVYMYENWEVLMVSNVVAFVSGVIVLGLLMKYLTKKRSLQMFGWYKIVLALVIFVVFWVSVSF
ncbi:undecaprenyl-diphosphate phosphatase [Candidatus Saccharibacteria bacterium]|nr:undecaprenyl-diphosphate phosphatase [Candidatus Saccharibacteria bacterium]